MKIYIIILLLIYSFIICKQAGDKQSINSCISCHKKNATLEKHSSVFCVSCHKGNQSVIDKTQSHQGLIAIPGNLSNVDFTCGTCHKEETTKIHNSPMTTNIGMIAINRKIFGEADLDEKHSGIKSLDPKNSAADSYYSQLCASCHLGMDKHLGAITGYQKGGGCLACHLEYSDKQNHPAINRTPKDSACFNCHSRSGRISLNYNGLVEMQEGDNNTAALVLGDGRRLRKIQEDIHKTKGISCVDCHKANDVMGDGKKHFYREDSVHVKCESCHKITKSNHHNEDHGRLDCTTCHSSWSPNCFGCHITYDPNQKGYNHLTESVTNGKWIEESGEMFIKPSALGITKDNKIKSFIPGMKLSIDKSGFTGKKEKLIIRNLFAPSFSHTITKKGRDCNSCHSNSYALGFGEGKLLHENNSWKFVAEYKKENGLPEDAWIEPFQKSYDTKKTSIRKYDRPFSKAEQLKILEVGRCLGCHNGSEKLFLEFHINKNYNHKR